MAELPRYGLNLFRKRSNSSPVPSMTKSRGGESPKVFTQPWKIRMSPRLQKRTQILEVEDECEKAENRRRHNVPLLNKTGHSAR